MQDVSTSGNKSVTIKSNFHRLDENCSACIKSLASLAVELIKIKFKNLPTLTFSVIPMLQFK